MSYCIFSAEFITEGLSRNNFDSFNWRYINPESACRSMSPDGRYACNRRDCQAYGVHTYADPTLPIPGAPNEYAEIAEWMDADKLNEPIYVHVGGGIGSQYGVITNRAENGRCTLTAWRNQENRFQFSFWKGNKAKKLTIIMRSVRSRIRLGALPKAKSQTFEKLSKRLKITSCENCKNDNPCTKCYKCKGCGKWASSGKMTEQVCKACGNCMSHKGCCKCWECKGCGGKQLSGAYQHVRDPAAGRFGCGYCDRCCGCGSRLPSLNPEMNFEKGGKPTKRYPRFLGVEIECGIPPAPAGRKRWFLNLHEALMKHGAGACGDASIRVDGYCGIEVLTAPSRGKVFVDQITDITKVLRDFEAKVNKSCGCHVHVDCRRLSGEQKLAIIRGYSMTEKALYSLVSFSRRGVTNGDENKIIAKALNKYTASGGYTNPWADKFKVNGVLDDSLTTEQRIEKLDLLIYGTKAIAEEHKRTHNKAHSRYHGLNVQALHVHNTIEFRMHQGTVNREKILMWCGVVSALVEYCILNGEEHVKKMKGSSAQILEQMMGDDEELKLWTRARRAFFIAKERDRRGLVRRRLSANSHDSQLEESEIGIARQRRHWEGQPVAIPWSDVVQSIPQPSAQARVNDEFMNELRRAQASRRRNG